MYYIKDKVCETTSYFETKSMNDLKDTKIMNGKIMLKQRACFIYKDVPWI